jgi:hypothetical protein
LFIQAKFLEHEAKVRARKKTMQTLQMQTMGLKLQMKEEVREFITSPS